MRKLVAFVFVLLCSIGFNSPKSFAKTVDEATAKTIGTHFLISAGTPGVNSEADLVSVYVASTKIKGAVVNDYYVFNINGGTGFVMVSADDIVIPVLAYSKESSFDINTISPSAKGWIDGYMNEIAYVIEHEVPAQPGTAESWSDLKKAPSHAAAKTTAVAALLTTLWDQAPYYNNMCPGPVTNRSVTGCVATAMAQLMKYWNWPTIGTGSHTYTAPNYPTTPLTANFGNTAYDWASMPNTLSSSNTAIATLMYHCGVAVDMDYSPTSSGAYTTAFYSPVVNSAEYALKTYFHYKRTLLGVPREGGPGGVPAAYTLAGWKTLLKGELDAHRPMIYSGNSVTAGGHAWVCDGYDATDKMHFNWGWSGTGPNGFYSVDAIAPPALGIGGGGGNFNNNQCVIKGLQPDSFANTTSGNIKMLAHISMPISSPMKYYNAFNAVTKFKNAGTTAFSGDFCAQVFDLNNNYVATIATITGQSIPAGDSTASLTFPTAGIYEMVPTGTYGVKMMYKPTGSSTWSVVSNNGLFINYNQVDVMNSQVMELYDSLHVGSHTVRRLSPLSVATVVGNIGSTTFNGNVQAALINCSTGTAYPIQVFTGQTIYGSLSQIFTFSQTSVTAPVGTYVLAVQHHTGASGSYIFTGSDFFTNPIVVKVIPPVDVPGVNQLADNISIYPNPANDVIHIDLGGATVNEIRIADIQGRELKTIVPANGQSLISVPVNNLASGIYFVKMISGGEVITKKITVAK